MNPLVPFGTPLRPRVMPGVAQPSRLPAIPESPAPVVTSGPIPGAAPVPSPAGIIAPPPLDMGPLSLFADRRQEMADAANGMFAMLERPIDAYLWWPWRALHQLFGSIPPEELWIIAGMSGAGKTTLLMSLLDAWVSQNVTTMYVGLEMPPKVLLIHHACRRLAARGVFLHPGDVLKGRLNPEHPNVLLDWQRLLDELTTEARWIKANLSEICRYVPVQWLTGQNMKRICEQAQAWGVKAIIVDHLDHLDADERPGSSDYEQHRSVLKVLHHATRQYGTTVIGAGQFNTDALKKPGSIIRSHQRPSTEMVQYGMLKRRICDILAILYKPLPQPPETSDEAEQYRAAMRLIREDPALLDRYLVPNTMGVLLDKDRPYGRDGATAMLGVHASRVTDADPLAQEVALRRLLSLAAPVTRKPHPAAAPPVRPFRPAVVGSPALPFDDD